MKTALKFSKWLLLGLALLFVLLVAGSYANHRWQPPREEAAYPRQGRWLPSTVTGCTSMLKGIGAV